MDMSLPTQPTTTNSIVSTWAGRPVQNVDVPEESIRVGENRTRPDHHDLTKRLFFYPFSSNPHEQSLAISAAGTLRCVSPLSLLRSVPALNNVVTLYDSFSFDSLTITCTLSAPKGACGSVFVGYYPHAPWFQTDSLATEASRHLAGIPNSTRLLLSPECHLMSISDSQDIKFTVPWTFATSMLKLPDLPSGTKELGVYGNPIVYIYTYQLQYLSSIVLPPLFKMTIEFNNMRFYGPSFDEVELQSGMEVAATVAAATLAEQLISSTLDTAFDSAAEYLDFDPEADSGYSKPTVVQQAFAGDTTSVGPPMETAIFAPRDFSSPSKHRVLDYLKRPQLVRSGTVSSSAINFALHANPCRPDPSAEGTNTPSSYLRWFAQGAQYWRGTLSFYVVLFGHPMAEVQHNMIVDYPGANSGIDIADPGNWVTLRGISSGTHCIKVPMPYLGYSDMLPIFDSLTSTTSEIEFNQGTGSSLYVTLQVISTMLDVTPVIPYAVFIAAEDDFCFFQPYAPGLNHVVQAGVEATELQVGIPEASETFNTRAIPCAPLPYMLPFVHVEDYMEVWSRCLPFTIYDSNDEPVPDPTYMSNPCFWPLTGGSAAWTPDVNNSWYVCNDYISLFSSQFLYYTGSVAVKVLCITYNVGDTSEYRFISLLPSNLVGRQPVNNPFSGTPSIPYTSNFGNGTTITPYGLQPVIECVLPYRSVIPWNSVVPYHVGRNQDYRGQLTSLLTSNRVDTNIILQTPGEDLRDALYRKKGKDYFIGVEGLLPPGMLWVAKGFDWSA